MRKVETSREVERCRKFKSEKRRKDEESEKIQSYCEFSNTWKWLGRDRDDRRNATKQNKHVKVSNVFQKNNSAKTTIAILGVALEFHEE